MSEEINIRDEILKLRQREPFVPFVIVMSSGDRYEVAEPAELVVGKEAIVIAPPARLGYSTLRFNQVSSVEAYER